jgi:DNA-entry nuclease
MKRFKLFAPIILCIVLLFSCSKPENISLDNIPEYSGSAYVVINGDVPFFTDDEITDVGFEKYSELDYLGRCGVALASVGPEMMPGEERESISSVRPSGWEYNGRSNNNEYDFVDGKYIYNRCHLIGHLLTGENDNEKNLITGTRYLNIKSMYVFEDRVHDFVENTGYHVMYRVTPMYEGVNLVASGVLIEGLSVEDGGRGISFCIYAYNVQPGVEINYLTGQNYPSGELPPPDTDDDAGSGDTDTAVTYVLNTSSKRYHKPDCSGAKTMKEENRLNFYGTLDSLIAEYPDYTPCGTCKP